MSAHTLGWVLSRGSARWCEALGALTTALGPAPAPGTRAGGLGAARSAASASPTAGLAEKEKKGGGHWGRGRGRGATSSRQKIPRKGEGSPPLQSPPPPKIIWKLLPISSGTSNTFLPFQADKALSRESPRQPSGNREGSQRAPLPQTPSGSARNHRSDGCHLRPTGRLGLQGAWPRQAPALLRARLVLRWIPRIYI